MSLSASQLAMRRTLLGASDFAILAGVSPYRRTVHDLWLSKVAPADEPQTAAQALGHELEPVALGLLARAKGLQLTTCTETRRHPELSFVGATPDALVGPDPAHPESLAEAKAPGIHYLAHWQGGIPDYVQVQAEIQARVWQVERVHVVALLGNEPRFYVYIADDRLGPALLELAAEWWQRHVLGREPPPVDGSEGAARMLRGLYPRSLGRGTMHRADEADEHLARAYFEALREEEAAAERRALAENHLKGRIGNRDGMLGDGWEARWSNEPGRVSWKAAAEAAGLREQDVEAHRGAPTRRFSMKERRA